MKERFVCVALDARKERGEYKDADGDFVRATGCVTVTASGSVAVVTAGAKALGPYAGPGTGMERWLREKLKAWEALPEAERRPGGVSVEKAAKIDPKRAALALPKGALVVRVFNRHLARDKDGGVRHATPEDFPAKTGKVEAGRYAMAQNDFMWVPEAEWRGLMPDDPKKGATHPAPVTFALRLFRYHLDPARGFTEGANFTAAKADAGELTLTIEDVSEGRVRLRLEGHADLRQRGRDEPGLYAPAVLGYLEYGRKEKAFTRFDIVALGDASGLPTDANGRVIIRKGAYPVGVAFELVATPTEAERLHPRGARDNPSAYLGPKERR